MNEEINYEQLRKDLIDYYGTAMINGFPVAMIEVINIENALPEHLVQIAIQSGYDLNDYLIKRL